MLAFTKMHGAGNDFVVLDLRDGRPPPVRDELMRMADRHFGIGCDQVMILTPPREPGSLAGYLVINEDGSHARQCGNGVRCLAAWLAAAGDLRESAVLDSPSGPVPVRVRAGGEIEVMLGVPDFRAEAVPIEGAERDGDGWRLTVNGIDVRFGAVSMGNPHLVLVVDDVAAAPVDLAFALQAHAAFAHGCNVGFAQVLAPDRIRLRVVERGVGETLACGSGACAAHAWLRRSGCVDAHTKIELPGGTLDVHWSGNGEAIRLSGPATFVFTGTWYMEQTPT